MSIELLRYPSYAFAILLLIGMALLILLFFIHWIVPKDMLRTYFREPYFSSTENVADATVSDKWVYGDVGYTGMRKHDHC